MPNLAVEVGPALSEEQAREIFALGEEAVVFALLELARDAKNTVPADDETPSTPSGMKPPYKKPTVSRRAKKKPGRKPGHP